MARVLVTGGAGGLGSKLTPLLAAAGHEVVASSRKEREDRDGVHYVRADLTTGENLTEAVASARPEVVINLASSPFRKTWDTDVEGATRIAEAARARPELRHFIHVGIVGDDQISLGYYKAKAEAERRLRSMDGLPLTVQRATQFHTLIGEPLLKLRWAPVLPLATSLRFQTVDVGEVAQRIASLVDAEPAGGRIEDMGGPRVMTLGEMAKIAGVRAIPVGMPGRVAQGFKQGLNTCPDGFLGRVTFEEWVAARRAAED